MTGETWAFAPAGGTGYGGPSGPAEDGPWRRAERPVSPPTGPVSPVGPAGPVGPVGSVGSVGSVGHVARAGQPVRVGRPDQLGQPAQGGPGTRAGRPTQEQLAALGRWVLAMHQPKPVMPTQMPECSCGSALVLCAYRTAARRYLGPEGAPPPASA